MRGYVGAIVQDSMPSQRGASVTCPQPRHDQSRVHRCSHWSDDLRCVRSCFICSTGGFGFDSQRRRVLGCFGISPYCGMSHVLSYLRWSRLTRWYLRQVHLIRTCRPLWCHGTFIVQRFFVILIIIIMQVLTSYACQS